MQFTVTNTDLVAALTWAAKSLPVRPSAPVLAGLKIQVSGNTLTLSAFDYEQSSVASVEVNGISDGTVLVSGRLLSDIARALPAGDVKFTLDGAKLLVQAKSSKFTLPVMPDGDYPSLPEHPTTLGSVDANQFADAVRSVVPASGRDDMLPILTAINVDIDPEAGVLTLVATDRFRLAVRKIDFAAVPGTEAMTALVPARVLDGWAKALTGPEGTRFTFGAEANTSIFSVEADGRSATVRLLDGNFPKWQGLLPNNFSAEAIFDASELVAAVKRVSLVAEKSTPAGLAFTADGLTVSATADSQAIEEVEVQHSGADITIGFNVAYLTDGLSVLGNKQARISLVASNKPAIIQPVDPAEEYTYLIMPMRGAV